jgi:hypothetical protein
MSEQDKEWYTSAEAAAYLKISGLRLGRLRREGRIKGIVGGGENPRYAMYHIDELKRVDTRDMRRGKRVKREKGDEDAAGHRWDSCLPAPMLARVG